ncbi:hypothetical protein Tco_1392613 [Tanacetum coccineum]
MSVPRPPDSVHVGMGKILDIFDLDFFNIFTFRARLPRNDENEGDEMGRPTTVSPTIRSETSKAKWDTCKSSNCARLDTIQLETAVSTISPKYLLEFTSKYGIAEELHPELPGLGDRIVDFSEDERVFPTVVDWRVSAPKDEMLVAGSYSVEDVVVLNTRRTPIQKQPEALLCLVGLSQRYFLGDDVYPTFLYDDDREMDLFNLISAPNPTKVKTGTRPRDAHEVPLLTATTTRVIAMGDAIGLSSSSRTPSTETVAPEVPPQENMLTVGVTSEIGLEGEVAAMGPLVSKKCRKRGGDGADANAPPKVLRKDHAAFLPT